MACGAVAGCVCEEPCAQVWTDLPPSLWQYLLGWGPMGAVCQTDWGTIDVRTEMRRTKHDTHVHVCQACPSKTCSIYCESNLNFRQEVLQTTLACQWPSS